MKSLILFKLVILSVLCVGCSYNGYEVKYRVIGTATDVDITLTYTEGDGLRDYSEDFYEVSLPWEFEVALDSYEGKIGIPDESAYEDLTLCATKNTDDNDTMTLIIEHSKNTQRSITVSEPYASVCIYEEAVVH